VGIEDGFQQAKNEVGLDHTKSASGRAGYRHTLALLAHAFLVVTRTKATISNGAKGTRRPDPRGLGLLPLTVPEVRRLLGGHGVDSTGPACLGAGLVTLAPTPSGPSATRTPPEIMNQLWL
jgi:hypothetical protein